jgi:hypothetical protein
MVFQLAVCPSRLPVHRRWKSLYLLLSKQGRVTHLPARVCNLATGLADYTRKMLVFEKLRGHPTRSGQSASCGVKNIPLRETTSRILVVSDQSR